VTKPVKCWAALAIALLAIAQSGCTMFICCDGEGPMKKEELGDWLGLAPKPAPEPQKLAGLVADLKQVKHAGFSGRYSLWGDAASLSVKFFYAMEVPFTPAPGLMVKGRKTGSVLVPGGQHGDWLYFDPDKRIKKEFYASEDGWDCLVCWFGRWDAYDVATRERVAARKTDEIGGLWLGWTRVRDVEPVDEDGHCGVHPLANPRVDPAKVKYVVRDGSFLLFGLVGWGRVNHTRYLQLLWIPIPLGPAGP